MVLAATEAANYWLYGDISTPHMVALEKRVEVEEVALSIRVRDSSTEKDVLEHFCDKRHPDASGGHGP